MSRIKLTLKYVGTDFCGWQVQSNAPSVQKTMTDALSALAGRPADVTGASRTDSGVHALGYVCHTDTPLPCPTEKIPLALNSLLPPSVRVVSAENMPDDFHARYSVISKTYRYLIYNSPVMDPFLNDRAWNVKAPLDVEAMKKAADEYIGRHDFSSFMAAGSDVADTVRTVFSTRLTKEGELVTFEVTGDGFLYNMVRIMAGTLVDIGSGKISDTASIIESKDRRAAGQTAPACGLYLVGIKYPESI